MANLEKSHPENIPGPLFTDTTCIDCGTCYHLGPSLFHEFDDEKSVVIQQPVTDEEWLQAKRAILSCPTSSIGVTTPPKIFSTLPPGLPMPITDRVFYLGYTSPQSFGATSYLIRRSQGNILVDSPRYNPQLVKELEQLGGVEYMFLSHEDDVADHEKFQAHFNLKRIIHRDAVSSDTKDSELILEGSDDFILAEDVRILMTPGHTKGHMVLVFDEEYLFTGDHLFVEGEKLMASRSVCWYSWEEQIRSVEKLQALKVEWILPGHGGWSYFGRQKIQGELENLLNDMKR